MMSAPGSWLDAIMKDVVVWTCLIFGALLILTQIVAYIIVAVKTGTTTLNDANKSIWERLLAILEGLSEKLPMVVAGVILILIAAVFSGPWTRVSRSSEAAVAARQLL